MVSNEPPRKRRKSRSLRQPCRREGEWPERHGGSQFQALHHVQHGVVDDTEDKLRTEAEHEDDDNGRQHEDDENGRSATAVHSFKPSTMCNTVLLMTPRTSCGQRPSTKMTIMAGSTKMTRMAGAPRRFTVSSPPPCATRCC